MSTVFGVGLSAEELKRAQVMFMITVFSSALTFATTPFSKVLYAFERFTVLKTMDIIRLLVRVSLSFLFLHCGGKGIAMVTLNFILNIIFSFATVICYIAEVKIKPVFGKIDLRFVKEIAAYSGLIFVQMIATQLNKMADQVLMGMMVASSSVIIGVYAIGAQITQYFESISSAVNGVLMPGVVRMVETGASGKDLEEEMVRIGRLLFMFLSIIYLVFLLFGHDFINLWAGNENEQAYYVAAIIMFPMLLHLSQAIGQQILWAKNKHKNQALLQVAIAVANVVFTILLIRWNPLFGATIATGITYFVGNVVLQNCFFKKHIGISVASYYKGLFRGIWLCLLLSAIGGASMHLFGLQGWFGFAVNCTVMCVIYAVTMLAFGMTQAEKGIIFAVVRKCKNFLKRK